MKGKDFGFLAGGAAGGFLINKGLMGRVSFIRAYPELGDGATIVLGYFLSKPKKAQFIGYGFIAAGVGTLVFDLYKRVSKIVSEGVAQTSPEEMLV